MGELSTELIALGHRAITERFASPGAACADLEPGGWIGLTEIFVADMIYYHEEIPSDEWIRYAQALDFMIECGGKSGDISRLNGLISKVNLSAALSERVSLAIDLGLLEPSCVLVDVIDQINMGSEEAASLASHWRDLDVAVIRQLRMFKSLLSPTGSLIHRLSKREALWVQQWADVVPLLP